MEYKKFDVVYTIQWPFDHFELDENKYITETEAKEKYEKKRIF